MSPRSQAPAVPGSDNKFLPWVQALRALAAFAVAFSHVEFDAANNGGDPSGLLHSILTFLPWYGGVDIFFVISGFVIVHASAPLFGTRHGPRTFIGRRLARIVPLYWIVTSLFIAVLLLDRSAIHGDIGSPLYCAASYFFIPMMRPDGLLQPAYGLGWTLNYEMFFYLVFTPFILFSRHKAVLGAVALLALLVIAGQIIGFSNTQLYFWSSPIILEFCAGMLIALIFARGLRLPKWLRPLLVLLAIAGLHFTAASPLQDRSWAFGIPAAIMVIAAALGSSPAVMNRAEIWLVRLGDASYAMYLIHPFVIRGATMLWHHLHLASEMAGIIYLLVVLVVAQIIALLINRLVERRLTRFFRGLPVFA